MVDFYLQNEYWFAAVQLALAMFGMGATLTVRDFREVMLEPKAVSIGMLVQLLAVPLLAWAFIASADISTGVLIGIALIAAIPGGTTSNIFTYLTGGNAPLSISITALTTLACLLTTPLILNLLVSNYMPADFSMPAQQIATEIGIYLLLPLILGMLVYQFAPDRAPLLSKWAVRASLFTIVLIVAGSTASGRLDFSAFQTSDLLVFGLFIALLSATGALVAKLTGLNLPDVTAIEMEVVVRNINLGLLINASLFPAASSADSGIGNLVLFTLLLYGGLQLALGTVLIVLRKRQHQAQSQ
jgi:BASS family bile acid:Na+ symporter